jgi:hypothetical protein
VYAQAVPAHIGHPSNYPEGDPYSDFLPPVVECDPETGCGPYHRAVVIVAEGREEKIGQRYLDPLLVMTGEQYTRTPFHELLESIQRALPWDLDVVAEFTDSDGQLRLVRVPGWLEKEVSAQRVEPKTNS